MKKSIFTVIAFGLLNTTIASACSTFSYQDSNNKTWVAKSYDFSNPEGYLFLNKKNISKRSLTLDWSFGKSWVSKYASMTFSQAGRDFPFSGMNDQGLNMEIMWLDETSYPQETTKPTINEAQIIQFVLDTASNTKEAIEQIRSVDVVPIMAPVHYMLCDKSNACATIEYLKGKLVINEMNVGKERILQNSIYTEVLNDRIKVDGSTWRESPGELNSIFNNKLAHTEEAFVTKSFENLETVRSGSWTKWQIVYNLEEGKAWFRTTTDRNIKSVSLSDYELDCREDQNEYVLDMNGGSRGDVKGNLIPYTSEINSFLLKSFKGVPDILRTTVDYYTSMNHTCKRKNKSKRYKKHR
jgi:choloylglycine hydrolase